MVILDPGGIQQRAYSQESEMEELLYQLHSNDIWNGILIVKLNNASLTDDFFFERAMRFLSLQAQVKVLKKKTIESKYATLCNRLLQMFGCAVASGTSVEGLEFSYAKYGKPRLDNSQGITFSMSNGKCYVAQYLLKTKGEPLDIGIDIASKKDYTGLGDLEIFRDIFSTQEYKHLQSYDDHQKDSLFAYYWSLKECYTKYIGTGLNCDLSKIPIGQVDLPAKDIVIRRVIGDTSLSFYSRWLAPGSSEIVTICYPNIRISDNIEPVIRVPKIYEITLEEILEYFESNKCVGFT